MCPTCSPLLLPSLSCVYMCLPNLPALLPSGSSAFCVLRLSVADRDKIPEARVNRSQLEVVRSTTTKITW